MPDAKLAIVEMEDVAAVAADAVPDATASAGFAGALVVCWRVKKDKIPLTDCLASWLRSMLAPSVGGVRVKMTRQVESERAKKTRAKFMVEDGSVRKERKKGRRARSDASSVEW